jgi:DNA-binding MarR family transcriptional regulator
MEGPDEVIHQSTRLRLVATLRGAPDGEPIEFPRLKAILGVTDGNLSTHLTTLENAGYVELDKAFVGKKPRTQVRLTATGRRAFERHVAYLRTILDA